jgi:hypothetical protein
MQQQIRDFIHMLEKSSVFSETFVNDEKVCQMRIKIWNLNINVPRQKKHCKTIGGHSKKY